MESIVSHLSGASNEHVVGLDRTITLICSGVSAAAEITVDRVSSFPLECLGFRSYRTG